MNPPHHPFRSEEARARYLRWYEQRASRWPVPSEDRVVDTPAGETFVRISGLRSGRPLLLLPGDNETSLSWAPLIERLSAEHRTYAVDQIFDYGRSVYREPFSEPHDFVRWLSELVDALELEEFDLAAYSYGAWIASQYALAHPDRLRRLALLAPASTVLRPRVGLLIRAMLYYFVPLEFVTRRYLRWYSANAVRRGGATNALVDEQIEETLLSRRSFKRHKFIAPTVLTDAKWARLAPPTLFVVGEDEATYSATRAVRRLAAVAPTVQTALIPRVGHDLLITEPDRVAREVLAFLEAGADEGAAEPGAASR